MSQNTDIQWCDSTVNPTMGCDGCELWNGDTRVCYAGALHGRFAGRKGWAPRFEEVTLFPGRIAEAARWSDLTGKPRHEKPWLDGYPRLIFVSDMSDALSSTVLFQYLRDEIIVNVTSDPGVRHIWLWLTKRPRRMAEFSCWLAQRGIDWPGNLWTGTSITTQATAGSSTGSGRAWVSVRGEPFGFAQDRLAEPLFEIASQLLIVHHVSALRRGPRNVNSPNHAGLPGGFRHLIGYSHLPALGQRQDRGAAA